MSDPPPNHDQDSMPAEETSPPPAETSPPQQRTGLAAMAFACSLVGLGGLVPEVAVEIPGLGFPFGGWGPSHLPGLIFTVGGLMAGVTALILVQRDPSRYGGRGLATAGVLVGLLGTSGILAIMLLHDLPEQKRVQTIYERQICARNMKMLGEAFRNAARDFGGVYPPRLESLIKSDQTKDEYCRCPASDATLVDLREDIETCYIYIEGQGPGNDPNNVLFYEPPDNHDGKGSNVYFNDGRLEFIEPYARVEKLVAATTQRLAKRGPLTSQAASRPATTSAAR